MPCSIFQHLLPRHSNSNTNYIIFTLLWIRSRLQWHIDNPGKLHPCDKAFYLSPWVTAKCSACHSGFFFFSCFSRQDHEQRHKSQQVPRDHFSQLCKHAFVLMSFFTVFLMTQYVSVIKGSMEEDSGGEQRDVRLHPPTQKRARAHTHRHIDFVLFVKTPVLLKKDKAALLFHSTAVRWHTIVFPPQWISMGVTERMGLLKCHIRGH